MIQFSELGLSQNLLKVLPELGIHQPTPVQEESIPRLVNNSIDFIGLAQTGTGKTAAFGLPLLQKINNKAKHTQGLVLAPTRELGQQIAQQLVAFSKYIPNIKVCAVYGGASIVNQMKELKANPQLIIATPGRLIDLIGRKAIKLNKVSNVILDEADEMLNMGFKEDIDKILSFTPEEKNTWLFSATMPREIRAIVKKYMESPEEVKVGTGNQVNENIAHQYVMVRSSDKAEALKRILDVDQKMRGIVFCRTKLNAQSLAEDLARHHYRVEALHGDLSQAQRDKVMKSFKAHALQVLVATDVAARGIDVNDLTHVIHYALPDDQSYYTHRSGRTARAGKKGVSLALVTKRDLDKIFQLERKLEVKFEKIMIPSVEDIREQRIFHWAWRVYESNKLDDGAKVLVDVAQKVLDKLSKEELIERLVSSELETLIDSGSTRDLNLAEERQRKKKSASKTSRFFINLGSMDNLGKRDMLDFICEQARINKDSVHNIRIQKKFSFFEVDQQHTKKVNSSFKGLYIRGRKLRVNRDA